MEKLSVLIILFFCLSCNREYNQSKLQIDNSKISAKDYTKYKSELVTNFLINQFKSEILDSLGELCFVKVNLVDACGKVNLDTLNVVTNKHNRSQIGVYYDRIRTFESPTTFFIDNALKLVSINSINDTALIIVYKIIFLDINDTSSIVINSFDINEDFAYEQVSFLKINHLNDVSIYKSKRLRER
jgi:hypothetical protein